MKNYLMWILRSFYGNEVPPRQPRRSLMEDKMLWPFRTSRFRPVLEDTNFGLLVILGTYLCTLYVLARIGFGIGMLTLGDDDGFATVLGATAFAMGISIWSYRWRHRCPNCAAHTYTPDLDTAEQDVSFTDTHHAYDTVKGEQVTISSAQRSNSRFRNQFTTTSTSTSHSFEWNCSSCGQKNRHTHPWIIWCYGGLIGWIACTALALGWL